MSKGSMRTRFVWTVVVVLSALLAVTLAYAWHPPYLAPQGGGGGEEGSGSDEGTDQEGEEAGVAVETSWKAVEELIDQQRYQVALEVVERLLAAARERGDEEEWTKALVKAVQLRIGLHGYETAVRFLHEEAWPEDPLQRAILELFSAHSFATYLQAYSWEIAQRERVASDEEVDLTLWTREQIAAAADRAFLAAWEQREAWGTRPVAELGEYIEANDYPEGIRSTLRDAVAYLWADYLGDSSQWEPEETNGVYRLDLDGLLASPVAPADLAEPSVHPLTKLALLVDDLERWHASAGRDEASFEARRSRIERLAQHFTRADDRERLMANLQDHLGRLGEGRPWWSVGMATLAELTQATDEPDALVRARDIAAAGERAHPDTVGGKRCRAIREGIEAPSFALEGMAVDGPERRSLLVHHKNLPRVYLRAYRLDLKRFVTGSRDWNLLPAWREIEQLVEGGEDPAAAWSVELPATPDFRQHDTYVVPPLAEPALYVIAGSAREDFRQGRNRRAGITFVLSDLVLLAEAETEEGSWRVTARSGATGETIPGVPIELYRLDYQRGHRLRETQAADGSGEARFAVSRGRGYAQGHVLLAEHEGQPALLQIGEIYRQEEREETTAALIYTDRSVYRPQQELMWKVVAYRMAAAEQARPREGGGGDAAPAPRPGRAGSAATTLAERSLTVELVDASGEVVASQAVTTNDYGSASGRFQIPSGRLLGAWTLRTDLGGGASVRVEEYKRPTFEVAILEPEAALRLNRPAQLTGEARYYFGLPVAAGEVAWRVEREAVIPYWRWWWWIWPPERGQAETIAAGTTALDPEGRFEIAFSPEADERDAEESGITYNYRLTAEVTDEGGETRSGTRSFRLGFVAVEARSEGEPGFFVEGEAARLDLVRTDLDGTARAGEARWRIVRLEQPEETLLPADQPKPESPGPARPPATETSSAATGAEEYRTPGDLLRPRWSPGYSPEQTLATWRDGEEVAKGALEHDAKGKAELALPALPAGAYRLVYTTDDPFGTTFELRRELLVASQASGTVAAEHARAGGAGETSANAPSGRAS